MSTAWCGAAADATPGMLGDVPFTVSHLAAVLPLRGRRAGSSVLPTAPLVAGAMVPDLPAVLGENWLRPLTHGLPAAFTLDVALTVVAVVVWRAGVRPAVTLAVPALAARWDDPPPWRPVTAWWWYVAAVTGSFTHVLWDAFTHSGEGASTWFPELSGHARLFYALQLTSSVVGLAVVLAWTWTWWHRTAARAQGLRLGSGRLVAALAVVGLAGLVGALVRAVPAAQAADGWLGPGGALGELVFGLLCGVLVGALLLAAGYWLERGARRLRAPSVDSPAEAEAG